MQEYDVIDTSEQVRLERPLAGPGSRLVASVVDHLILAFVYLIALLVLLLAGVSIAPLSQDVVEGVGAVGLAVLILVLFSIYWFYFLGFELLMNGQTPGKKYVDIRVTGEAGSTLTFTSVAIRNFLRVADGLGCYLVGGVFMFFSPRARRLGDMAAGTVVMSEEIPEYSADTDSGSDVELPDETSPENLRATGLEPEQYQALKQYWTRRSELSWEARENLLPKLLRPVLGDAEDLAEQGLPDMEDHVKELLREAGDMPHRDETGE